MTMPPVPTPAGTAVANGVTQGDGINWGELIKASGGAFEPLPASNYDVQVVKSEATKSGNGKTMFKLTLNVITGPHTNRKVWTQLVVSPENPNALGILFAQMKAFGLGTEFFAAQPSPDAVASALEGKYANVAVIQRTWQGQLRNEVKSISPAIVQGQGVPSGFTTPPVVPAAAAPPAPPAPAPAPSPAPAPPTVDLDAYRAAGWTDEQLIAAGHMEAPAPPPPAPPAPPAAEAPAPPPAPAPPAPPVPSAPPAPEAQQAAPPAPPAPGAPPSSPF